jgi:adenylate cyclase
MAYKILLIHPDPSTAQKLRESFSRRGDEVWVATSFPQARAVLGEKHPTLVVLDLHFPGGEWFEFLTFLRQHNPQVRVVITNRYPDLRRELLAKSRGVQVFLRAPFTHEWIERALKKLEQQTTLTSGAPTGTGRLPRVRMPMKVKITFPYVVLALLFALGASFLVSRYIMESLQDRFTAQLVDVGKLSADWMVQEENRLLETLRLLANTQGIPEVMLSRDADRLREIALPVAVNYQDEIVNILDAQGVSLLALVHIPGGQMEEYKATQGDTSLAGLEFIQNVLQQKNDQTGNKFAGLVPGPAGDYLMVAGPVLDENGQLVGVIAIGNSLASLSEGIRTDTLAQMTFYALDGSPLTSTLLVDKAVSSLPPHLVMTTLQQQDLSASTRELTVASARYTEILGPLEARGGKDLGLVGASLAQNFLARPSELARFQVLLFVVLAFVGVIILGMVLAQQITRPLSQIVKASVEVARGNLEIKVPSRGNDEVMVLAHAFNLMISGLQEGFIYRDLLGRTVSPEVREALRQSFASGDLRLEGQNATAAVLISDIRGFTALSEKEEPTTILNWLNEYFGELVPVVTSHGGVVDKFEGDAMLAFFGILPKPLPAQESAYHACQAAIEMLAVIEGINARRVERGEPPLVTGISVHTGCLTAGGLGTSDRLDYTIIGDTVNTTQRMGEVTRAFGESGIVASNRIYESLAGLQKNFLFDALGQHAFKGKKEPVGLYRLFQANSSPRITESR